MISREESLRILVTGGAGFIGSHIVDAYVQVGHHVTVFDNLATGSRDNVNGRAEFIYGDIRDTSLGDVFRRGRTFSGGAVSMWSTSTRRKSTCVGRWPIPRTMPKSISWDR